MIRRATFEGRSNKTLIARLSFFFLFLFFPFSVAHFVCHFFFINLPANVYAKLSKTKRRFVQSQSLLPSRFAQSTIRIRTQQEKRKTRKSSDKCRGGKTLRTNLYSQAGNLGILRAAVLRVFVCVFSAYARVHVRIMHCSLRGGAVSLFANACIRLVVENKCRKIQRLGMKRGIGFCIVQSCSSCVYPIVF